jgi:UDP-glucose/iron transport system permease protein
MNPFIQTIPIVRLAFALVPVLAVVIILFRWSLAYRQAIYAVVRMLAQLLLIGYFLVYIFKADNLWIIMAVATMMVAAASWIALGTAGRRDRRLFAKALFSISLGGGVTLLLITQGVLGLEPWYAPRYFIPLAGMIFANCMNGISLAAERFHVELEKESPYEEARNRALRAALIPITNMLFAVGLVSLPGMMTGQILSGVDPMIAVRFQIMVMCMVYGSAGMASACFLALSRPLADE